MGNDLGVLRSVDGGGSWSVLDDLHFPRVPVFDLVFKNGHLRAATYGRGIFAFVNPTGPAIAVNLEHNLGFGTVCQGPQFLTLTIYNVGVQDLIITSVQRLMGSTNFSVLPTPGTPLVLNAGEEIEFTVVYNPAVPGPAETATIRIISNDPNAPVVDLSATGTRGAPRLTSAIADNGDFGAVCLGSLVDRTLTINNSGVCPLSITNITSSLAEFIPPAVAFFPISVSPGASVDVPIRFQPATQGAKAAVITVFSNDPGSPRTLNVTGTAPAPRLNLLIANTGNFGNVCVGSFRDLPLILNNSGRCALSVNNIISSAAEFLVPSVTAFPLTIAVSDSLDVPIRFQPASFGVKNATITVSSDDPAGVRTVAVSGYAPSGKLAVTGSLCFGGVKACCRAERTLYICNVGDCDLHVTSVAFKKKNRHWKLVNNPFPATLHPGSCLGVVIRYKATERCPRCCELAITSDDPATPVKVMDVMAYTIWDHSCCMHCCDDCKKGCCQKTHHDPCCCEGRADDCCEDDEDEHENHDD